MTLQHKVNALYALAALGSAEPAFAANLFDSRAELDTAGRALLARALVRLADKSRSTTLITELLGELGPDGAVKAPATPRHWDYYGSPVRTQALILEALAAFEPQHVLVGKLADGLLAARQRGRWRTTQESSYALFALSAAERAETASERSVAVFVNGQKKLSARFGLGDKPVQSLRLPMSALGGTAELVIAPKGGPVRYSARLVYAPTEPPRVGSDRGLSLARTYERVKTPESGMADFSIASVPELAAGELVRVTLHMMVPRKLEHAVIDDPLPAGLEAVNVALATEARASADGEEATDLLFTHRELRDDRVVLYAPMLKPGLYRRVYLARATTPGTFGAPSVRGEGMYHPEVFGSTPATELRIIAPVSGVAAK